LVPQQELENGRGKEERAMEREREKERERERERERHYRMEVADCDKCVIDQGGCVLLRVVPPSNDAIKKLSTSDEVEDHVHLHRRQ
jgi:hypothetical protein